MEYDPIAVPDITADGTTGPINVETISEQLGFSISGTFVASIQPQIALDAADPEFVAHGSAITGASTPARISVPACALIRFVTTGYLSGTAEISLGGIRSTERHD
jgi:hypothetical protein